MATNATETIQEKIELDGSETGSREGILNVHDTAKGSNTNAGRRMLGSSLLFLRLFRINAQMHV